MSGMEVVAQVVAGSPQATWCDTCQTSEGYRADIYAMVASGLQLIGVIESCTRCELEASAVRCFYCSALVHGGGPFFEHVRDRHGEAP